MRSFIQIDVPPSPSPSAEREGLRRQIAGQVQDYLSRGGQITRVPIGASGETLKWNQGISHGRRGACS